MAPNPKKHGSVPISLFLCEPAMLSNEVIFLITCVVQHFLLISIWRAIEVKQTLERKEKIKTRVMFGMTRKLRFCLIVFPKKQSSLACPKYKNAVYHNIQEKLENEGKLHLVPYNLDPTDFLFQK